MKRDPRKALKVNSALRTLANMFGQTPIAVGWLDRSWIDYGYPQALNFAFYHLMYTRLGLARAVVGIKTDLCWLNKPTVYQGDREDEAFKKFARRTRLWSRMKQLDVFQSVGHYAGLIVRVADGLPLDKPLADNSLTLDKVLSFTPAWESQLVVGNLDTNPKSPRYGLPITYTYQQRGEAKNGQSDGNESVTVHYSRVIIMSEGAAGNTIFGQSDLEAPYNSLISWSNIVGAGGEGFKRMASARHVLQQLANGDQFDLPSEEQVTAIAEALEDMQQDPFSAVPYLGGMELKSIQASLSEPKGFAEAALNDVSAACGFSSKALVGAQTGRLAGEQDGDSDRQRAQSRCDNYLADFVLDFLDWLSSKCRDYDSEQAEVEFPDLMAPSTAAMLDNALKMTQINKESMLTGGVVFRPSEIRKAAGYDEDESLDDMDEFTEPQDDVPISE